MLLLLWVLAVVNGRLHRNFFTTLPYTTEPITSPGMCYQYYIMYRKCFLVFHN